MHLALERIAFVIDAVRFVESVFDEYGIVATEKRFGFSRFSADSIQPNGFPVTDIAHGHSVKRDGRELSWISMLGDIDREDIADPLFGTCFVCVSLQLKPEFDMDAELYFSWSKGGRAAQLDPTSCDRNSQLLQELLSQYGTRPLSRAEQLDVLHRFARTFLDAAEDLSQERETVQGGIDAITDALVDDIFDQDEELRGVVVHAVDLLLQGQCSVQELPRDELRRFVWSHLPFRRAFQRSFTRFLIRHPERREAIQRALLRLEDPDSP